MSVSVDYKYTSCTGIEARYLVRQTNSHSVSLVFNAASPAFLAKPRSCLFHFVFHSSGGGNSRNGEKKKREKKRTDLGDNKLNFLEGKQRRRRRHYKWAAGGRQRLKAHIRTYVGYGSSSSSSSSSSVPNCICSS